MKKFQKIMKEGKKYRAFFMILPPCMYIIILTESSKSPASIAKSNKQWVGTCLYQEECKLNVINLSLGTLITK